MVADEGKYWQINLINFLRWQDEEPCIIYVRLINVTFTLVVFSQGVREGTLLLPMMLQFSQQHISVYTPDKDSPFR